MPVRRGALPYTSAKPPLGAFRRDDAVHALPLVPVGGHGAEQRERGGPLVRMKHPREEVVALEPHAQREAEPRDGARDVSGPERLRLHLPDDDVDVFEQAALLCESDA